MDIDTQSRLARPRFRPSNERISECLKFGFSPNALISRNAMPPNREEESHRPSQNGADKKKKGKGKGKPEGWEHKRVPRRLKACLPYLPTVDSPHGTVFRRQGPPRNLRFPAAIEGQRVPAATWTVMHSDGNSICHGEVPSIWGGCCALPAIPGFLGA